MPTYHVTALEMPIYFNREGDHDHNGLIFALTDNVPILKFIRALGAPMWGDPNAFRAAAQARAANIQANLPATAQQARQPHPLVRPLVLRVRKGDHLNIELQNEIRNRHVGLHLVGDGYAVITDDGSQVGNNPSSLTPPNGQRTYSWKCDHEGVFPFHDAGNYSGGEDGTNAHGLFGALVVEPAAAIWRDPVTGRRSEDASGAFQELDGLYMDILPQGQAQANPDPLSKTTLEDHVWPPPEAYPDFDQKAHREFVIVFHDEPEFQPPHAEPPANPCGAGAGGAGHGAAGGHGGMDGHAPMLPIMPISYRAEPLINREHTLWRLLNEGHVLTRPVLNEEQHHSSWMFGDPATPILKAYIGDPVRIRLLHAGVLETHVFHLHLYEWHAVPADHSSPRIDAISISPQTGHTIEPVWGAGDRQQAAGDTIWHCHLYPHFHEGMWGIFRTFETRQDGTDGAALKSSYAAYAGRKIGRYPDGTPIEKLLPLPDRPAPPTPTADRPGYPLYIPGDVLQKSPMPPWPLAEAVPGDFDYRPVPTDLECWAFNDQPVPGEMFTRNRTAKQQDEQWAGGEFDDNDGKVIDHDVAVVRRRIDYNSHGWYDPDGHLYYLEDEGDPDARPGPKEPLFFRAQHGQILNLTLTNDLPAEIEGTAYDLPFPPCPALPWEGECSMHVHMVKFDPVCADGGSVGWNYISAPRIGRRFVYRWWADQEFGTIFFHDHLFANYRQKHGLFGALIVEPIGAQFLDAFHAGEIVSGLQARIRVPKGNPERFREFCIAIGDFIPMFDRFGVALNPPDHPGGHGDQGVMALNYRSEPLRERPGDPAYWFSSRHHPDPATTRFLTFAGDPVRLRLVQGSHEEQHSFQVHGMRWRRFRDNAGSSLRNQQTFGIAEAFTFDIADRIEPGDYLYKLSSADDIWLGCWGLIRSFPAGVVAEGLCPLEGENAADGKPPVGCGSFQATAGAANAPAPGYPDGAVVRRFRVIAERRRLTYRNPELVDPFGLVYRLVSITDPNGVEHPVANAAVPEPLILRCRQGEWVQVTLENHLPPVILPEPFAPEVPVEARDAAFRPVRPVSSRVSLHADMLLYDVTRYDGANVGMNPEQTAAPGGDYVYKWHAAPTPGAAAPEALGPVLLQDMADVRNHRHHGLIGALIVEPANATPYAVAAGEVTAAPGAAEAWHGARATVVAGGEPGAGAEQFEEVVLLLQDGLRLYLNGNPHFPIPDAPPAAGEADVDAEDQGQKGFNYRTEPVGPNTDMSGNPAPGNWLANPNPATPVFVVPQGQRVRLHLLGACDKPRNHSVTVHGVAWPEYRFLQAVSPMVASESAITSGSVRTFEFSPEHPGDHAYRSGVLKWAVSQGLWGIVRVV
jgi:FtsP/CotA-like multicopper oxidase with cupredoxin domain